MLGMIGDFKFEMTKKEFDQLSHEITWSWTETKRIGNHPKRQASGKSDETITISGSLILQNINSFNKLIEIADKQEPVSLSFINGTFLVVIKSLKKDSSDFLKTGEYRKQDFVITVSRFYI